jgi:hypothetical protein
MACGFSSLGVGNAIREGGCTVDAFKFMEEYGCVVGRFEIKSRERFCGIRIMRSSLQEALLGKMKEKEFGLCGGEWRDWQG